MTLLPPIFKNLPSSVPVEGAVSLALEGGIPIFRASQGVQSRIEALLQKQGDTELTPDEIAEVDCYAEIDDYLSFVNRTIMNSDHLPQAFDHDGPLGRHLYCWATGGTGYGGFFGGLLPVRDRIPCPPAPHLRPRRLPAQATQKTLAAHRPAGAVSGGL